MPPPLRPPRCGLSTLPTGLVPAVVLAALLAACGTDPAPPEDAARRISDSTIIHLVETARARISGSEGGRLVLSAIEAHGGLAAWYGAPTSSYTWAYANQDADLHFETFLVADNQTRRVYHDLLTLGPYGDPRPVQGRMAWDGTDAWIVPDSITQIDPRFWATTGYYFQQIPFVLADPGLQYERLPADTLDGVPYDLVRVSYDAEVGDSPGDTYTLYVDRDRGRVHAIRYTVTYGQADAPSTEPRETLLYYEDYVTVDGLAVPTRFRGYHFTDGARGAFKNEAWADSISFRRSFDAARLQRPPSARVAPPPGSE